MSRRRKGRALRAVKYNAGDIIWYRSELLKLIRAMNKDVRQSMIDIFESNSVASPETGAVLVAVDANPVTLVKAAVAAMSRKWISLFTNLGGNISDRMVENATQSTEAQIKSAFRREDMTIQMQMTPAMIERQEAIIAENVSLIRSIPEKYFTEIEGMVYRAVSRGGDRKALVDELMAKFSEREGITRRRAEFIARDQVRKATSALSSVRQQAAGITHGEWIHSGGQAKPRHSHVKAGAEHRVFELSKGCYLDGMWVMPAELPNCSCSWRPILPF